MDVVNGIRVGDPERARPDPEAARVFAGESEMAACCRAFDWGATPLGPVAAWPPALRTAVRLMLATPVATALYCGPSYIILFNDAYRPILGRKRGRALGRPVAEVWAETWPAIEPQLAQVRGGGPPVYAEEAPFRVARRAGGEEEDAWFTYSFSALSDDAGEHVAVYHVAFEVTSSVRGRTSLVVEHSRLEEVFRQSPSFLAVLRGPDDVFELANEAYYDFIGRGRDIIGKPLFEALPEVRDQGFEANHRYVRETGKPLVIRDLRVMIGRIPGAPPEERFMDVTYLPLVEADGSHDAVIAHGADVTEQVRARRAVEQLLAESEDARKALEAANEQLLEQQLELELANQQLQEQATELEMQTEALQLRAQERDEHERHLRTLADAIPTLAWTARSDGYIDWYNARWYEYTGTTPEQMAGWGWQSVHDPDVLPDVLARWQASIASGQPFEMTFPLRGADGRFRRFLTRVTPLRDAVGAVLRWFGTNTDVEAERRARELAEEANEAKTRFLATMSHELRTPLNAIAGYAELLEIGVHGPLGEAQRDVVGRILRSERHLLGLINDVLNFAKLEAGHVDYRVDDVPVRPIIDTLEALVAPQLEAKGLRFDRDDCADGRVVRADPDKLQQILVNLLSNAIKFTPTGGTVSMHCADRGDVVDIAVRDTGIGIAADRLADVFAPFVQIDRRLNAPHEGTGLGLAISRDLARGMGGDLTAESTPGEGSTFTVTLPRGG